MKIYRDPRVSEDYLSATERAIRSYDTDQEKAIERRAGVADGILSEARDRLIDAVGGENYAAWRRFVKEHPILVTPGSTAWDLQESRREALADFFSSRQMSREEARSILAAGMEKAHEALMPPAATGAILGEAPGDKVLRASDWTVLQPPYHGERKYYYSKPYGNFVNGHARYLTPSTGFCGTAITLKNSDAGNWDSSSVTTSSCTGSWFLAPSTGLLEVYIEGQVGFLSHWISLKNEFGFSDSTTYQSASLKMIVGTPEDVGGASAKISTFKIIETSGSFSGGLTAGATYWAHLFSEAPVTANSWVWIWFGSSAYDYSIANDVSVSSSCVSKWFLKSVWVRTTG